MSIVNRVSLSRAIYDRLGGSIPHIKISRAIGIIIEQLSNDLVNDQVVTVRNFGTLSPHLRIAHLAYNVSKGTSMEISAVRSVKFHAHESFKNLILDSQERFRQKDDDNS
jgi:nucleoid DNA-binding protein